MANSNRPNTKLMDTQLVLLSAAAQRDDGLLIADSDACRPPFPRRCRPPFRFDVGHHSEMKPATL